MYCITVKTSFNSAHRLRDYKGKCESLHGHNWLVEANVRSDTLNLSGMVMDFTVLKKHLRKLLSRLDHKFLNETKPFDKVNPTSENIAKYIYEQMKPFCKRNKVIPSRVTVWETPGSCAAYSYGE